MIHRATAVFGILVFSVFAPWWMVFVLVCAAFFAYSWFYEGLFLAYLFDVVYGYAAVGEGFFTLLWSSFFTTFLVVAALVAVEYIKQHLLFYEL